AAPAPYERRIGRSSSSRSTRQTESSRRSPGALANAAEPFDQAWTEVVRSASPSTLSRQKSSVRSASQSRKEPRRSSASRATGGDAVRTAGSRSASATGSLTSSGRELER